MKLVERFEPQSKIKNGGKTGKKGGNHQVPPFFCEDQCRQGERQEDEGDAYADHLHPVAHWICVLEGRRTMKAVSTRVANSTLARSFLSPGPAA